MAETGIGKLVTEMALKDEKFRQSLRQLEALAKVTKSSLQDLSNIEIGKDGKLVFNPAPLVETKKSLADLRTELAGYKQQLESTKLGTAEFGFLKAKIADTEMQIKSATKTQEGYRREVTEGEKAFKGYIAEQRVQDRAFREGTNAILGITTALTLLTQGNETTSNSVKKIERSLLATVIAINTVEFSLFSLGQMGTRLGGTFGMMLTRISALAGPIAMVVGIGAGLIAFFQKTNDEAKKAADEGLNDFANRLKELDAGERARVINSVASALANARKELQAYSDVEIDPEKAKTLNFRQRIEEQVRINELNEKNRKELQDQVTFYERALDRVKESNRAAEITQRIQQDILLLQSKSDNQIVSINARIDLLNQKKKLGVEYDEKGRRIVDEIARLEAQRNLTLETTVEKKERNLQFLADEQKRELELQKQIATASTDTEEQKLLASAKTERERIEIQKNSAAIRLRIEFEYQDTLLSIERDRINALLPYTLGKEKEMLRQQLKAIEDKKAKLKTGLATETQASNIGFNIKVGELPVGSIAAQQQKVAVLQRQLDKATDDQARELLRKRYEYEKTLLEDMQRSESERFQIGLEQSVRIASTLSTAFSKSGDDFLQKLSQALQIALNIARVVQTMNTKGSGSPLDFLEIFANVAGVIALFDSGGHTGFGDPSKPAGVVHRDEIVFENAITKNNRADLMRLRSQLQSGMNIRDSIQTLVPKYLAGQGTYTAQDLSPLLNEIRALREETRITREAIENLPAPQVNLPKGIVTIDDAMIQATPRVEKHFAQKNVD